MSNKEHIEHDAINVLEYELKISDNVTAMIQKNDKMPSWDGHIKLSVNSKQDKIGKYIPVQVKGTRVKNFSEGTITHPVSMKDLINYREHHGTLFFVIQMKTRREGVVFFEYLLPVDIDRYTKNKSNQQTVNITLKRFDSSTAFSVEQVLMTFFMEFNKQNNKTVYSEDLSKLKAISITTIKDKKHDFITSLVGREIYLHGETHENDKRIELASRVNVIGVSVDVEGIVRVGDKIFYNKYKLINEKDDKFVQIGSGFKMKFGDSPMKFEDIGTLNERIKNYEFLFDMAIIGEFHIGQLKVENVNANFDLMDARNHLKDLQKIREFFDFIGIYDDVDLTKINEEDLGILDYLMRIKYGDYKKKCLDDDFGLFRVSFAEKKALIYINRDKDSKPILENPFSDEFEPNVVTLFIPVENREVDDLSVFFALDTETLIESINVKYEYICNSILRVETTLDAFNFINELALKILKVYDINKDKNAIECSIKIFERLNCAYNDEIDVIVKTNLYQCYQRVRELEESEIETLIQLKYIERSKIEPDCMFIWAFNVLLQNKLESKMSWNKLKNEDRDKLMNFPIYNLFEVLITH